MDPALTARQAEEAFASGDWSRAGELFEAVVKHDKKNAQIHLAMGFCATRLRKFDAARKHFAKAQKISPMLPDTYVQLGYLEAADFNSDKALEHYRRAVLIKPGHPPAIFGLVDVLRKRAEYDEASKVLDKALAKSKATIPNVQLAEAFAAIAVKTSRRDEAIGMLGDVLASDLNEQHRSVLMYRLANLLDDAGDHLDAFDAVLEASRLKHVPWDAAAYDAQVEQFMKAWTAEAFTKAESSGLSTDQPVFIVGMPRSGTSLVEQIIASHPEATGVGELPTMVGLAGGLQANLGGAQSLFFTQPALLTGTLLEQGATRYLESMHTLAGKLGVSANAARIADKLPHNYAHLPLIRLMFPNAKIIYTVRDPRDTAVSCFFQGFDGPMGYTYDLNSLGRYIAHERTIVDHARRELGIDLLPVQYEDLVSDPEGMIRRLLDHIGLPFHEDCLAFHKTKRQVVTASTDQVRRPIYTGSIERWRRYGDRLDTLLGGFRQGGLDPIR